MILFRVKFGKEVSEVDIFTESYKLAQKLLYATYDTEQEIYLQSKIDEIKMAVSNKKSAMAWKAVNDVSGRKIAKKLR